MQNETTAESLFGQSVRPISITVDTSESSADINPAALDRPEEVTPKVVVGPAETPVAQSHELTPEVFAREQAERAYHEAVKLWTEAVDKVEEAVQHLTKAKVNLAKAEHEERAWRNRQKDEALVNTNAKLAKLVDHSRMYLGSNDVAA